MLAAPIPDRFKGSEQQIWRRNVHRFVDALANDTDMDPDFSAGLRNQEIQEAVTRSAESAGWVDLPL